MWDQVDVSLTGRRNGVRAGPPTLHLVARAGTGGHGFRQAPIILRMKLKKGTPAGHGGSLG
jgi:hypothetical protein